MPRTNVLGPVLAADPIRQSETFRVDMGHRARHVVKRREADSTFRSDHHGVVLGVSVDAADEPIEHVGARKGPRIAGRGT